MRRQSIDRPANLRITASSGSRERGRGGWRVIYCMMRMYIYRHVYVYIYIICPRIMCVPECTLAAGHRYVFLHLSTRPLSSSALCLCLVLFFFLLLPELWFDNVRAAIDRLAARYSPTRALGFSRLPFSRHAHARTCMALSTTFYMYGPGSFRAIVLRCTLDVSHARGSHPSPPRAPRAVVRASASPRFAAGLRILYTCTMFIFIYMHNGHLCTYISHVHTCTYKRCGHRASTTDRCIDASIEIDTIAVQYLSIYIRVCSIPYVHTVRICMCTLYVLCTCTTIALCLSLSLSLLMCIGVV